MYFIAFLFFIKLSFAATLAPSVISLHNICSDTVVAMPFLYCTIKLLACICFQVVLFFTLSVPTESVQRALRMVVFLTQSVVDVFGVLRDSFS
jgi:hypothetical protein